MARRARPRRGTGCDADGRNRAGQDGRNCISVRSSGAGRTGCDRSPIRCDIFLCSYAASCNKPRPPQRRPPHRRADIAAAAIPPTASRARLQLPFRPQQRGRIGRSASSGHTKSPPLTAGATPARPQELESGPALLLDDDSDERDPDPRVIKVRWTAVARRR